MNPGSGNNAIAEHLRNPQEVERNWPENIDGPTKQLLLGFEKIINELDEESKNREIKYIAEEVKNGFVGKIVDTETFKTNVLDQGINYLITNLNTNVILEENDKEGLIQLIKLFTKKPGNVLEKSEAEDIIAQIEALPTKQKKEEVPVQEENIKEEIEVSPQQYDRLLDVLQNGNLPDDIDSIFEGNNDILYKQLWSLIDSTNQGRTLSTKEQEVITQFKDAISRYPNAKGGNRSGLSIQDIITYTIGDAVESSNQRYQSLTDLSDIYPHGEKIFLFDIENASKPLPMLFGDQDRLNTLKQQKMMEKYEDPDNGLDITTYINPDRTIDITALNQTAGAYKTFAHIITQEFTSNERRDYITSGKLRESIDALDDEEMKNKYSETVTTLVFDSQHTNNEVVKAYINSIKTGNNREMAYLGTNEQVRRTNLQTLKTYIKQNTHALENNTKLKNDVFALLKNLSAAAGIEKKKGMFESVGDMFTGLVEKISPILLPLLETLGWGKYDILSYLPNMKDKIEGIYEKKYGLSDKQISVLENIASSYENTNTATALNIEKASEHAKDLHKDFSAEKFAYSFETYIIEENNFHLLNTTLITDTIESYNEDHTDNPIDKTSVIQQQGDKREIKTNVDKDIQTNIVEHMLNSEFIWKNAKAGITQMHTLIDETDENGNKKWKDALDEKYKAHSGANITRYLMAAAMAGDAFNGIDTNKDTMNFAQAPTQPEDNETSTQTPETIVTTITTTIDSLDPKSTDYTDKLTTAYDTLLTDDEESYTYIRDNIDTHKDLLMNDHFSNYLAQIQEIYKENNGDTENENITALQTLLQKDNPNNDAYTITNNDEKIVITPKDATEGYEINFPITEQFITKQEAATTA